MDASEIRHGRHVVSALHVHLVFVAKCRRHVFDNCHIDRLRGILSATCEDFGATLVEMNGGGDHVHLMVEYPPQVAISRLVNSLKGVSSRLMRKEFPGLVKRYYRGVLWSPSYFAASCGGAPLSVVQQYISQQSRPVAPVRAPTAAGDAPYIPALKDGALRRRG